METKEYAYDATDVGCWIDGAFGIGHACHVLSIMMIDACPLSKGTGLSQFPSEEEAETYQRLSDCELSDDHCELDEAIEFLEDVTEPGLIWVWAGGDLLLITTPETA